MFVEQRARDLYGSPKLPCLLRAGGLSLGNVPAASYNDAHDARELGSPKYSWSQEKVNEQKAFDVWQCTKREPLLHLERNQSPHFLQG